MAIGSNLVGKVVLVRAYGAGVHVGVLMGRSGKVAQLSDSHRIWRWRGANTLSEASQKGISQDYSRVSEKVPEIVLSDVIEIMPVSDAAKASLTTPRWP